MHTEEQLCRDGLAASLAFQVKASHNGDLGLQREGVLSTTAPRRLGLAAALGVASQLLTIIAGLWATPHLLKGLGDSAYAALAIVSSFATYFVYLELGLGAAYMRGLAAALSTQEQARAQRLVETSHYIYLCMGLIGTVGMFALGIPYLAKILPEAQLRQEAQLSLGITAALFLTTMALSASRGVVFASQRTDIFARLTLVLQPAIPLFQVLVASRGLFWVLLVQATGGVIADLYMLHHARKLVPFLRFQPKFHHEIWQELRSFSLYKFASQLAFQGQLSGDRLLLGYLLPSVAALAPYTLAASIAQRLRTVAGAIGAPFFPAASERFAQAGREGLLAITLLFVRRVSALLALGCASGAFLAKPFLSMWVGESYAVQGEPVFLLLLGATAALTLSMLLGQACDAAGRPQDFAKAAVLGLLCSALVSALLVPWHSAIGAAWGFLAGSLLQFLLLFWFLVRFLQQRSVWLLLRDCLLRPLALFALSFGMLLLLPNLQNFWANLVAAGIIGLFSIPLAMILRILSVEDLPARLQRLFGA